MDKGKAIDRARKLMAMAADSSSPNEAAIAARRARAIMDKYQLDTADLADKSQLGETAASKARSRTPGWEQSLCICVAKLNDCVASFNFSGQLVFKGFAEDVEVSKFMFFYIVENGKRACKEHMKKNPGGCRNSFKLAYAWAIADKIKGMIESRKQELKTSSGKSLVLAKMSIVEQEFGEASYGERSNKKELDLSSRIAGQIAGQKTNIVTGLDRDPRQSISAA